MSRVMVQALKVSPRPQPLVRHGQQFDICFPSYYQVLIDVTAGWTASLVPHLYTWVDWGNVSKVSC